MHVHNALITPPVRPFVEDAGEEVNIELMRTWSKVAGIQLEAEAAGSSIYTPFVELGPLGIGRI
jgi:hypothetical protein